MNIHELSTYNLADAVKFHRRLNPRIWGRDEHLLPEVRGKLLAIAADFQEFLGVEDLNVQDITISGSNAAYSYTKNSDIDLHLIVQMPDNPVYQELFTAKKYQYNSEHNIKIGGADVELYVQPADQAHHSQGIYSIRDNKWISVPQRKRAQVDDVCVRDKVASLDARIHSAVRSKDLEAITQLWDKIKAMRKIGLEQHGEFGCENIAFKMLRNSGCIKLLKDTKTELEDQELSLREADRTPKRFRYGFSEGMQSQPYSTSDGVAASTKQFLEDSTDNNIVQDFIQQVTTELGIDPVPEIHLHTDPDWSEHNHSFGRYDPESHTLNVSMPNRHVMDVLRTVAHELVHCSQNQQHGQLPDDAGETGSRWENDANARAGIIMRDWANSHPEHFDLPALEESASGYIPKNKREAAMPQYAMALSVDIKPGQVGKEANKLALKTGRNGEPGLLMPDAENLLREFSEFVTEQENLFEITMSPSSLKKLSAQTGALAGMEFEMIVPGAGDDDDGDQEPDYDFDQRCRSIQDARDFFYDGDFNSRRDIERMSDRMQDDYAEWLYERLDTDFTNESEYLISEWVANNVDESEWNPDDLEGEARQEALDEFISNVDADPSSDYYQQALDEYREENRDSYDESDWLDAEDLDLMSGVENAYSISWPHWRSTGGGESSIEDVADSFQTAIGRDVQASSSYHSGRVERPSTKSLHYIVEPDSSLDPDDSDAQGLEFVSPPLPIEELLSDLNKVKAWADKTGCYTNDSTGLHINVSVPGWSGDLNQLDYVKLALLLGDEFVLSSFGRTGNTYAKSAMGKIRDAVRRNPDRAQELMDKMKSGMDQLASKIVHGRSTEKYTSINVKNGYIEFRSPGGDWLNDNFAEIENTLRRFTVALSAAVDPEAYRQEYLKKLYKVLDVGSEKDPLSYFAKYAAGELPRAALKSFVRQAQAERKVKSGKADAEEYDKLAAIHQELGLEPPQRAAGASTTASHPEGRGRPHDPTGRYAIVARSDQAAYGRTGGPAPTYQFRFNMQNLEDQGHGRYVLQAWAARNSVDPADYIVVDTTQYADAAQGGTIDVATDQPAPQPAGMGQWNGQWRVLVNGEEVYRFGNIGNSQADANRIAAQWLRDNGQGVSGEGFEVYPVMAESLREAKGDRRKFADGYLVFSDHLYDRLRDRSISQNSVEQLLRKLEVRRSIDLIRMPYIEFVVKTPDLALAIAKTRDQNDNTAFVVSTVHENLRSGQDQDVVYLEDMPQPSHGPGAIKDLNEPLGPEFPPTMPAGTVKVDVSDVYDWYKLGQHISNMKDLGQHDFGQGPPSAILSFGDEDLEHQYIQALKRTGLTTTDIDPVDPDQPPGMPRQKTDPTYNVDENFADGINKMFNNLGDPVYANLQRVALLAMQGRQQEAAGRLQSVIKSASPDIQKKIIDAVNNIKPVTINGKIADSSTLDKSKQHQDWILNTFIPWVQSLLGQQGMSENFADGKNPGRKGLSKRVGVNTKASVSDLRKTAKNSSGEKQRMSHWLANMKAGRAKAKRK